MLINLSRTEQETDELIFTLEIAEIAIKSLPVNAYPEHKRRLERLIHDLEYYKRKEQ